MTFGEQFSGNLARGLTNFGAAAWDYEDRLNKKALLELKLAQMQEAEDKKEAAKAQDANLYNTYFANVNDRVNNRKDPANPEQLYSYSSPEEKESYRQAMLMEELASNPEYVRSSPSLDAYSKQNRTHNLSDIAERRFLQGVIRDNWNQNNKDRRFELDEANKIQQWEYWKKQAANAGLRNYYYGLGATGKTPDLNTLDGEIEFWEAEVAEAEKAWQEAESMPYGKKDETKIAILKEDVQKAKGEVNKRLSQKAGLNKKVGNKNTHKADITNADPLGIR